MPQRIIIDPGEQELMRNIINFAARKATNGVYMGTFASQSIGQKALVIIALGEQADALAQVIHSATVPDETIILNTSGGRDFLDNGSGH